MKSTFSRNDFLCMLKLELWFNNCKITDPAVSFSRRTLLPAVS